MNVYVGVILSEPERAAVQSAVGETVWFAQNPADPTVADFDFIEKAEIVLGWIPLEHITRAKELRWVQLISVGLDAFQGFDWARIDPSIEWTNIHGILADQMAQTMLGGLLALNRGIDQLARFQEKRSWQKPALHLHTHVLAGNRVLLLGGGTVNRRFRELLAPYACTFVVYAHRTGDVRTLEELERELAKADIVAAALPDLAETRKLLNPARLVLLKRAAVIINVGRGSLIDEPALIEALQLKKIRGAILDVTAREPLPPEDPLWNCPNLILTQHTAGGSNLVIMAMIGLFAENLKRFRADEPLLHRVDWTRGY